MRISDWSSDVCSSDLTTYATLRSDAREAKASRVQQIVDWLSRDFDGVIVFDESHAMQNDEGGTGERGDQAPSQQRRAALRLQPAPPHATALYLTPTGPTPRPTRPYAHPPAPTDRRPP